MAWIQYEDHGSREGLKVDLKAEDRQAYNSLQIFNERRIEASATLDQQILFSFMMSQNVTQSKV